MSSEEPFTLKSVRMSSEEEEPFCGDTLKSVRAYYLLNMLGYIDIPICIIGVILNMFNVLVFTRRNMTSPVNLIFTHLAFVNLSELLAYISLTWINCAYYQQAHYLTLEDWTYTRGFFSLRSRELANLFNNISVYIIMVLAVWKYVAVFYPSKESQWCDMKTTRNTLVAGYIVCILLVIPENLSHYVERDVVSSAAKMYLYGNENHPITWIYVPSAEIDSIMYSESQVVKVGLYELLPSLVLSILCVRLIVKQWLGKEHQSTSLNVENRGENLKMKQQTYRSITVVALCLSFVIPLGLLDLVDKVFVRDYHSVHYECFQSFRIIFSILNCINKSVTFLVYYAMDQDFKVTFKSLFDKNNASFWKLKYVSFSNTRSNDEGLEIGDRI
ncbi:G-protein coupled receptor dmsr-1-like [Planococcus citri]|uniref:G-protein coupled receptor dmsr-1-like n=1 Tax=Planococcus citri TaxID=170843 RepID=UPI0031F80FD8